MSTFEVVELNNEKVVTSLQPVNHVYVVDVSGSMYSSLPKMRTYLKNVVSMITKKEDTFSIIFFSGKGQCGVVCQGVSITDGNSLAQMQAAIDRYLVPIGLTGFYEPLKLAMDLTESLPSNHLNNLVMLTDGYDNQFPKKKILETVENLPDYFASITFMEYGYYCDRDLLSMMAMKSGGRHLFVEGMTEYEKAFPETITKDTIRSSRKKVSVNKKAKQVVYTIGGEIVIADVFKDSTVFVPEAVPRVYAVVPGDVKKMGEDSLYMMLFYGTKTNNIELVWKCLEKLGDVKLSKAFMNAFTKQELTNFMNLVESAVMNKDQRFLEGKDHSFIPPEDATTVIDIIDAINLCQDDVYLEVDSDLFKYNRISRSTEAKEELPKFVMSEGKSKITGITYNSSRPNVSLQCVLQGVVKLPENDFGLKYVDSFTTRNYAVVRDGLLNIDSLPITMSNRDYYQFEELFTPSEFENVDVMVMNADQVTFVVDLKKFPVISRSMASVPDLDHFAQTIIQMEEAKAKLKGLKAQSVNNVGRKIVGMTEKYGEDAAKWLSSIGIRDYGFSPKVTQTESTDFYVASELSWKIKSLSSLPAVKKVQEKLDGGKKLTLSESLVNEGYSANVKDVEKEIKKLEDQIKHLNIKTVMSVYGMLLGRTWFRDCDEDQVVYTGSFSTGDTAVLTIERVDKEIKI